MAVEKLDMVFSVFGCPPVIPYELTPRGVYEEKGLSKNDIESKISFWKQGYHNTLTDDGSLNDQLFLLENYYLQNVISFSSDLD